MQRKRYNTGSKLPSVEGKSKCRVVSPVKRAFEEFFPLLRYFPDEIVSVEVFPNGEATM